jgi:hypothetical protein
MIAALAVGADEIYQSKLHRTILPQVGGWA